MILCIGEILADMIGEGDHPVRYARYAGGAPFNVACGITKCGGRAGFVGKVGDDIIGKYLIDFVSHAGLEYACVTPLKGANTTLAFVQINEEGDRDFCFFREHTADYQLSMRDVDTDRLRSASAVHIGSLMCSKQEGRDFIDELFAVCRSLGIPVSFDVNYRADLFESQRSAMEIYRRYAKKADIVKLSEEELTAMTGIREVRAACDMLSEKDKLILVTLGGRGSAAKLNGMYVEVPSVQVKPVDTTGAGDAFLAGTLSQLENRDYRRLSQTELTAVLKKANIVGALTTTRKGAIDAIPKQEEVLQYLQR